MEKHRLSRPHSASVNLDKIQLFVVSHATSLHSQGCFPDDGRIHAGQMEIEGFSMHVHTALGDP
jgi:hypothetical protein